jgi:O-antigen/teichoic acid export membrane protein
MLLGDAAGEVLVGYAMVLAAVSLGPAGFGTLSEAQAFMDPFEMLSNLGMANVAITVAAARGACDGILRGTVWRLRMAASLLVPLLVVGLAAASGRRHLVPLLAVLGVGMLAAPTTLANNLPFYYEQRVHRRIAIPALVGAVRLATAYLASRVFNRPLGYQLSVLAGGYFFLHGREGHVLGEYAAADRLTRPAWALANAIFFSSLPTLARLATEGSFRTLQSVYRRSLARVACGMTAIVVAAWFAGPWLIATFAPEYRGAIGPFRILAISTIFNFVNQLSTTYMLALGRFRVIMSVAVTNLVVYVLLASTLIPRLGASGAAWATAGMEAFALVVELALVWSLLGAAVRRGEA